MATEPITTIDSSENDYHDLTHPDLWKDPTRAEIRELIRIHRQEQNIKRGLALLNAGQKLASLSAFADGRATYRDRLMVYSLVRRLRLYRQGLDAQFLKQVKYEPYVAHDW